MHASREEGISHFELDNNKKIVLVVGGSLGARSINNMMMHNFGFVKNHSMQFIWQTGRGMYEEAAAAVKKENMEEYIKVHQFISRMDLAYAAADIVISRAGAIAISELCLVGKPIVLIPSPNVAEDHQTKNAMALVNRGAALMVKDTDCQTQCLPLLENLLNDTEQQASMQNAISALAVKGAADKIVDQIAKIIE